MKNTFTKILLCVFALLATSVVFGAASDVISSVTVSGTTFTIKRNTTTYPTRVYYRTCNGSAIGGVHFTETAGYVDFLAGESTKTIEVQKLTPATSSVDAYEKSYYSGGSYVNTSRYFYLEVWNSCTSPKFALATLASNNVAYDGFYSGVEQLSTSGMYQINWTDPNISWNLSEVQDSWSTTRRAYLNAVGQTWYYAVQASLDRTDRWNSNENSTADLDWLSMDADGSQVLYCKFRQGSPFDEERSYRFPVVSTTFNYISGTSCSSTNYYSDPWNNGYSNDRLYSQTGVSYPNEIRSLYGTSYLILPKSTSTVTVHFGACATGGGERPWTMPHLRVCLYDNSGPSLQSVVVNTGKTYTSGEKMYIALRFNEIVEVSSTSFTIPVTFGSTSFDFSYAGGSGTNVLYFYGYPTVPSSSTSVTTWSASLYANDNGAAGKIKDMSGNTSWLYNKSGSINIGQKYTITYYPNSGTINNNEVKYYTYGVSETLPTNVTRTGYTFGGWYENSSFTGSRVTSISTTASGNKTYYAKWTANTYPVTLDNQSATSSGTASVTATYNSAMPTLTSVPVKTGYTFNGYYAGTNGTTPKYYKSDGTSANTYTLTSGTTLYAYWTVKTPSVTLSQQNATTNGTTSTTATYGSAMPTLTSVPSRTGYTFKGYYTGQNGAGTQYYYANGTSAKNCDFESAITLYPKWEVNTYTVSLNQQNATNDGTTSVIATYGSAMPSITLPKRTGYTFGGFYTNSGGSGTQYYTANGASARSYLLTSNTTLYAKWTKDTYTITYVNNNGTINGTATTSYQFGNTVTLPTDVTRDGCSFGGWYNNANCEGDQIYTIDSDEVGNKTFYAKWTPNTYDVRLHPGEGRILSGEVTSYIYGVGAILPTASAMSLTGKGFAGWYDNPEFEGDAISEITVADFGEKDFYALWEENTYPVVLNTNEGIINSGNVVSYKHGTEKLLPSDVTRTGYTFEGWYENSSCIGTAVTVIPDDAVEAKTYWAKWREQVYDIAFEPNEGTINDDVIPTKYTFSVGASLPANVTRNGYAFAGWYDNAGFEGQSVALIRSSDYGNKTYYANWNRKTYTIAFNNNGGDIVDEVIPSSYMYEEEVTLPSEVFKEGYEFLGWYDNPNFYNDPISKIEKGDFGNKTFYAKWLVESYDVVFVTNGGKINSGNIAKYTYGVPVNLPTDVTCTGYTFAGWCSDEALTSDRIDAISLGEMGIKTFYAKWTNNSYAITLNPNEGVIRSDNVGSYVYGSAVELPTDIVRVGYTFNGWFANPSYLGSQVQAISATDYGDKEFWAKWTVNDYKVTLNTNGGTITSGEIDSYIYGVGATLPTAKNFVKTGATFGGWYADEEFSSSLVVSIPVNETGDKEFWAKWTDIDYTITYNVNEGQFAETPDATYTYGGDTVVLPTPSRDGYEFGGWFTNSSYIGSPVDYVLPVETGNKEFWAKWNVNSYSITYNVDGGTINNGKVTKYIYGTTVLLPVDVTKIGYTFDGWYTDAQFTDEPVLTILSTDLGDKTFYAKFTINTYNIILVTNDGTINSDYSTSYNYGEGATLPSDVTKEGYTFVGWFDNSNGDGTAYTNISDSDFGNKTFWAIWNVNSYAVTVNYDKSKGFVEGAGTYNHNRRAVLTAKSENGQEFVGWSTESTSEMLNGVSLLDSTIQFSVTEQIELTANFRTKEYVYATSLLTLDTLKTGVQNAPIDLAPFFKSSNDGEIFFSASSSNPSIVAAEVVDGKLFLTTNNFKGEAEITVTAKLANNEKTTLKATAIVEYDCDITIADVAITNVSCYGLADGKIELTAAEDAEYSYQWINSESTANVLENIAAGNYQVVITDEHLCEITKTFTVSQPDEVVAEIAGFRKPKCGAADGEITVSAESEYDYLWSNGASSKDLTEVGVGDYTVTVTDPANGCSITLAQTIEYPANPVITVETVEKTRCDQSAGAAFVSVDNEVSYNWTSAGETISKEQNLTNVAAGIYTLTVTDENNCSSTETVEVKNFEVQVPQISLVTVSKETGKNLIVWVRENTDLIDYYTIYRMDSAAGEYSKIGMVKYSEISVYEDDDKSVNPMARQWSYKITATDICGNETAMSEAHTTLHLGQSPSLRKGYAELAWDPYVGVDYRSFYIIRETTVGNYTFIDTVSTVPASLSSYSAEIPTVGKTIYYVAIKLNGIIDPKDFMKAESGPFAIALSNIAEAENMGDPDAIESVEYEIEAYAVGHTIYVKNAGESPVKLYDVRGQRINSSDGQDEYEFNVSLGGVYLVKVGNKTAKVLVQ
ncbi:MAG: InlB B-repeat-containing protein [Bacteroidales bacterium]|nr:InlB B-repeat-containing protein [Bacteroidales bacterium]